MKNFLVIISLLLTSVTNACLNVFAVDSAGNVHYLEHYFFSAIEFRSEGIANHLKKLEKKFANKDYSFQNISDYGAYLLMAGRFDDGLILFRALIQKYPDSYQINANTAVAYELTGNIDSALYFEKQAIRLNPGSHGRSEWIHLKILEAKKKLQSNPNWCLKNNVTGIVDSIQLKYVLNTHESYPELFEHFIYQLNERLPFTYGEDRAMGKLLFELGDAYQAASIYRSYYCYALAKYFYPALSAQADPKMQKIRQIYSKQVPPREVGKNIKMNDETRPPDENDVKQFITKIINRPGIKKSRIASPTIELLILKI